MIYSIQKPDRDIIGEISLAGSKSISNRVLIIRALCEEDFPIHHLATALDTRLLETLLNSDDRLRDAGAAGTTFRFLTAFLSLQSGTQILSGSQRMKQRPIGPLVNALRELGAGIEYLERTDYPPLKIGEPLHIGRSSQLSISAATSSQYISALLMIAPLLPYGLSLSLEGKIVSRPYIEMTLKLMAQFGVEHSWENRAINILPQKYRARDFSVEADWSAASYYYAMGAFSNKLDLQLNGLFEHSVQGDAVLAGMMEEFGIQTTFNEKGIHLSKPEGKIPELFQWGFIKCPDLAQTLAVVCAALGVKGVFTGLETLRIKETDRIAALQTELRKVKGVLSSVPLGSPSMFTKQYHIIEGKAVVKEQPCFSTYEDHRMAMAFAPLAMFGKIKLEDPQVVEKSYPDFWKDLAKLGFLLNIIH